MLQGLGRYLVRRLSYRAVLIGVAWAVIAIHAVWDVVT